MTPIIVNSLNTVTWRDFIDRHPQGNIFQTPEMYQVFSHVSGYKPQLWAAIDDGEVLVLFIPVQITFLPGPLRRLTRRNISYGGCLFSAGSSGKAALAALLDQYDRSITYKALYTELRNLTDISSMQPILQSSGYTYEDHLNYLINLHGTPEQVMQRIGARTRKNIRHALNKGRIQVEEINDLNLLPTWYGVIKNTYANARVPLAGQDLFKSAYEILFPKGMVKFWLAWIDKNAAAASVELLYKDKIYGWYGGVDRRYASELPGEVLMWRILEWGAKSGYKVYDFGGAGKPDEAYGVRDFKAKFGGDLVCFGRNKKIHSPGLLWWSKLGYGTWRKLAGLFP